MEISRGLLKDLEAQHKHLVLHLWAKTPWTGWAEATQSSCSKPGEKLLETGDEQAGALPFPSGQEEETVGTRLTGHRGPASTGAMGSTRCVRCFPEWEVREVRGGLGI